MIFCKSRRLADGGPGANHFLESRPQTHSVVFQKRSTQNFTSPPHPDRNPIFSMAQLLHSFVVCVTLTIPPRKRLSDREPATLSWNGIFTCVRVACPRAWDVSMSRGISPSRRNNRCSAYSTCMHFNRCLPGTAYRSLSYVNLLHVIL